MTLLLLLTLLSCCSCWDAALGSAIQFLPYGMDVADLQLVPDSVNFSSAEITLNTPIRYYGRTFNSAFVSFYGD